MLRVVLQAALPWQDFLSQISDRVGAVMYWILHDLAQAAPFMKTELPPIYTSLKTIEKGSDTATSSLCGTQPANMVSKDIDIAPPVQSRMYQDGKHLKEEWGIGSFAAAMTTTVWKKSLEG
eukprot:827741-Amphidinium_carterae.2